MQKRKNKANIVLTGGHAGSTAYATIEELRKSVPDWNIYFIGAQSAVEGRDIKTLEEIVFPKIGVKYLPLYMGRIQRKFSFWTIPSLIKIPLGFVHSFYYLLKIRPKIVLSFGGYASFPVVFVAWLLGMPVYIHEQTCEIGRANKYSSVFADKIFS